MSHLKDACRSLYLAIIESMEELVELDSARLSDDPEVMAKMKLLKATMELSKMEADKRIAELEAVENDIEVLDEMKTTMDMAGALKYLHAMAKMKEDISAKVKEDISNSVKKTVSAGVKFG